MLSTYPTDAYQYLQGTSMASPVVAGAAALLFGWAKSRNIAMTGANVESLLSSSAESRSSLTPYFKG